MKAMKLMKCGRFPIKIHEGKSFLKRFINPHLVDRHRPLVTDTAPTKVANNEHLLLRPPEIVIACKNGRFWVQFEISCSDLISIRGIK